MNKVELLAPAGDLSRGKIALDFGADAIYLGGKQYSLRSRASNFDLEQIEEISNYAHERNKKFFLVTNIVCHNSMVKGFENYLDSIKEFKPDAFICSDPYIIRTIHAKMPQAQIHVSTQQSICNSKTAAFFARNGATRVILAREVSHEEEKLLIQNVNGKIEVESFVHGAVCIAYSGRCMLSNNFCYRDANNGGCAQSCRWECDLLDEDKNLICKKFTMSAKDMCLLTKVDDMIDIGVTSFKIEGRMKSEHYIATVVNAYRKIIDSYYSNNHEHDSEYYNDVKRAANRETDLAWYNGKPGIDLMLYHEEGKTVNQIFAFTILEKVNDSTYKVLTRNNLNINQTFEIIGAKLDAIENIKIKEIVNEQGNSIQNAPTPMTRLTFSFERPINLQHNDIGRISPRTI